MCGEIYLFKCGHSGKEDFRMDEKLCLLRDSQVHFGEAAFEACNPRPVERPESSGPSCRERQ